MVPSAPDPAGPTGAGGPLEGLTLLLLRPWGRGTEMTRRLEELGARVVCEALTRTESLPEADYVPLDRLLSDCAPDGAAVPADWLLFTSVEGVRHFLDRAASTGRSEEARRLLAGARVAAVGPATAAALAEAGRAPDLVPGDHHAEGLAAALCGVPDGMTGRRVVLIRALEGRAVLIEELERAGAAVHLVPVYRTLTDRAAAARVAGRLAAEPIDLVVATSGGPLNALSEALEARPDLRAATRVAALGPVTAAAARRCGFELALTAPEATAEALVLALAAQAPGPAAAGRASAPDPSTERGD